MEEYERIVGWKEGKRLKCDFCRVRSRGATEQMWSEGNEACGCGFPMLMFPLLIALAGRLVLRVSRGRTGSWIQGEPSQSCRKNRGQMGNRLISENYSEEGPGTRWTVGWWENTDRQFSPSQGASNPLLWGQEQNPRLGFWASIWKLLTR